MKTLFWDESSVLRGSNELLGLIFMFILTLIILVVVFLVKWVVTKGHSAPEANRGLLMWVLATMAFTYFLICALVKDMDWGAALDMLLPGK